MTPGRTILEMVRDFFPEFCSPSWRAWRVFLAALFGLPMDASDLEIYRSATGRTSPPADPAREAWLVVGRRGGKSRIVALIVVYLALFRRYHLAPGERGVMMVLAATRSQAKVVFNFIVAFLRMVPMLQQEIVGEPLAERIELSNGIDVEVHTAAFRSIRGRTVVAACGDEIAFWRTDDAANPDTEILAALRPAMATMANALLLALSSPYARRGELWTTYKKHFGQDDDPILVWQADTPTMNPAIDAGVIAAALEADEARARAEYFAEFRRDIESFLSAETLEAARGAAGVHEIGWLSSGVYVAFVDPSGGSRDSFTLAIAHAEPGGRMVVDAVREQRPPFSPETTVAGFVDLLRAYHISQVTGDRYAGEWPREQFRKGGIGYVVSVPTKSELYLELLPLMNSGRVELPEHPRLFAQLGALERRTIRGGRDTVDHPPAGHDDLANAVAGAVVLAARQGGARLDLVRILETEEDKEVAERRNEIANGDHDLGDMPRRRDDVVMF